jgi:hypothetical protein
MAGGGWLVANRTANPGIYRIGEWASRRMVDSESLVGSLRLTGGGYGKRAYIHWKHETTKRHESHETQDTPPDILDIRYWVLIRRAWEPGPLVSRPDATGDRAARGFNPGGAAPRPPREQIPRESEARGFRVQRGSREPPQPENRSPRRGNTGRASRGRHSVRPSTH